MLQDLVSVNVTLWMMVFPMFLHEYLKGIPFLFIYMKGKENLIIGMSQVSGFIKAPLRPEDYSSHNTGSVLLLLSKHTEIWP